MATAITGSLLRARPSVNPILTFRRGRHNSYPHFPQGGMKVRGEVASHRANAWQRRGSGSVDAKTSTLTYKQNVLLLDITTVMLISLILSNNNNARFMITETEVGPSSPNFPRKCINRISRETSTLAQEKKLATLLSNLICI